MEWLGLNWDRGPYYQTQRFDRYKELIDKLLEEDKAYKCYCSAERLEKMREEQMAAGEKPRYDGHCRDNPNVGGDKYVIRFRNPQEGSVVFDDHIRGRIEFANTELDDLIVPVLTVHRPITSVWWLMTGTWTLRMLSEVKTTLTTHRARLIS